MWPRFRKFSERNENYPMKKHIHRIRMQSMFEKHIKQKSLNI